MSILLCTRTPTVVDYVRRMSCTVQYAGPRQGLTTCSTYRTVTKPVNRCECISTSIKGDDEEGTYVEVNKGIINQKYYIKMYVYLRKQRSRMGTPIQYEEEEERIKEGDGIM